MSESAAGQADPFITRAQHLVARAINNKGRVISYQSPYGPVQSFEEQLCRQIFDDYVTYALEAVDEGRWQEADSEARARAVGRTAVTLRNQQA